MILKDVSNRLSMAKGKHKRQLSPEDPISSIQMAAKKARPDIDKFPFAIKVVEDNEWVLYDNVN